MGARLVVVAGCNGAGKSTLTARLKDPSLPILDPDAIAREHDLSPVAAGREALRLFDMHCRQRRSFLIETTLSGRVLLSKLRSAREQGFRISLRYVGLQSPELAVARVKQRVRLGGHDVPEEDIRRRYLRKSCQSPECLGFGG